MVAAILRSVSAIFKVSLEFETLKNFKKLERSQFFGRKTVCLILLFASEMNPLESPGVGLLEFYWNCSPALQTPYRSFAGHSAAVCFLFASAKMFLPMHLSSSHPSNSQPFTLALRHLAARFVLLQNAERRTRPAWQSGANCRYRLANARRRNPFAFIKWL